jgi:hypothetical protein
LTLFPHQGSTQRRVKSLLRRCEDVTSDLELLVQNPEEGCDDEDDAVDARTLTLKLMSLEFSLIEDGLDTVAVCNGILWRIYAIQGL